MEMNTIAAIATAMSPSGIGIVRISGGEAFTVIDRIYRSKDKKKRLSKEKTHTIHYGYIYDGDELIDEVMVAIMKAPHTYTAEDTVEIDCHGGVFVTKRVLETVIKYGAEIAEPGEFTKRAFLNGRIDLSKAEAVIDVINAKNDFALKNSLCQLNGVVIRKIKSLRDMVLDSIAFIEAALDDPEHISIEGYDEQLAKMLSPMIIDMGKLIEQSDNGRILSEGIKTVILGKPNAGKSSLMNALLGGDRAIVTEIAGTTRDTLEEQIRIGGIGFKLIDTAGIRTTDDIVEKIGVNKAKEVAKDADLILYVVDSSVQLDDSDTEIMSFIKDKKAVIILNKNDLTQVVTSDMLYDILGADKNNIRVIQISAKEKNGLDILEESLKEMFLHGEVSFNDEVYLTNIRQRTLMQSALSDLERVKESINNHMPEDFFTIDLMSAYENLGKIIGESVEEDVVNRIFSKFCMGK